MKVLGCAYRSSIPAKETHSLDLFFSSSASFSAFQEIPAEPTFYLVVDRHKQENFRMTQSYMWDP